MKKSHLRFLLYITYLPSFTIKCKEILSILLFQSFMDWKYCMWGRNIIMRLVSQEIQMELPNKVEVNAGECYSQEILLILHIYTYVILSVCPSPLDFWSKQPKICLSLIKSAQSWPKYGQISSNLPKFSQNSPKLAQIWSNQPKLG